MEAWIPPLLEKEIISVCLSNEGRCPKVLHTYRNIDPKGYLAGDVLPNGLFQGRLLVIGCCLRKRNDEQRLQSFDVSIESG